MAIKSVVNSKILRMYGEKLGREGLAQRVIELCEEVAEKKNYKEAIKTAGMIRAIAVACNYDVYLGEKAEGGFDDELDRAKRVIRT